jgi:hypothetical protein
MDITKTADDRYHVEVRSLFINEDVNGSQLLGMGAGRIVGVTAEEILRFLDSEPVGHSLSVEYI